MLNECRTDTSYVDSTNIAVNTSYHSAMEWDVCHRFLDISLPKGLKHSAINDSAVT